MVQIIVLFLEPKDYVAMMDGCHSSAVPGNNQRNRKFWKRRKIEARSRIVRLDISFRTPFTEKQ